MWSPRRSVADSVEGPVVPRRSSPDAVTFLTVYLVLLVAIPSRLTFAPLGGAGSPAQIVGLTALAWWVFHSIQRTTSDPPGARPVRLAFIVMACAFLASYVVAMSRPIDPGEASTADLGMLAVASWGGVLLLAHDGIVSRERLDALLHRLVVVVGLLAALGIVQFVTGDPWVDRLDIPGLRPNSDIAGLALRSGFTRPAGTATHPIEFGSVIAMVLPVALTLALNDTRRSWLRRWLPVLAMGLAAVMSISRSALIASLVGLVVVSLCWKPRRRLAGLVALVTFSAAVCLTVPGLVGSLLHLFTGIADDSSAQSRSGSYDIAAEFIARSPFFGRGLFTFLPSYRILDNQYLNLSIEVGFVGLAAFLALIGSAVWCAATVRRRAHDERTRQVGQSLVASILAGAAGLALFDGFSFPMSSGLFFLVLGLAGAMRRLHLPGSPGQERAGAVELGRPPAGQQQRAHGGPALGPTPGAAPQDP